MIATLTFDLDDPAERYRHEHASRGLQYRNVLEEFTALLQNHIEGNNDLVRLCARDYALDLSRLAVKHQVPELKEHIQYRCTLRGSVP